ncbi:D-beta-hydroxybutyrate dehydrogenase, mitochondrial-like [Schistocerca gregaria]|uniref:D-beta-hydroxybutyrate dehydrogenase, mitochondrial-like n=1 Tax=Schistocerca gregaria TaxID=7010 RepID=UPI00211ED34A|nr:D-beta-hydroxybutyrate dehydrogenase, mitochondrial-like [Schistocerca gregaria]
MAGADRPWDVWERLVPALLFSHAAAVLAAWLLGLLGLAHASAAALFFWFAAAALGSTLAYHNLKVSAAGKVVVITGCESRIGYALAKRLDELGFTIFAGFTNANDSVGQKLREEASGRLHLLQLDVTSEADIRAAVALVRQKLPSPSAGVWAVINNASIATFGEVEWVPFPVFQHATEVNLFSVVRITQAFLPLIRKTKGRVINVVSILGRVVSPLRSSYCAAKFGVEAFSDCLRLEMRRWGVDVVVVEPGDYTTGKVWINDEKLLEQAKQMWRSMTEEAKADYGEDYFERKIRSLEYYTKGPETDLEPVLKSLTDAVQRTFPLPRYTPVSRAERVQAFVAEHLPRSVYDLIYN